MNAPKPTASRKMTNDRIFEPHEAEGSVFKSENYGEVCVRRALPFPDVERN